MKRMSVYTKQKHRFQPIPEDGKIRSAEFINASRCLATVLDMMGTAFKPLKSDVLGNCDKLQKKYEMDPEKFITFDAMLEDEIENNNTNLVKTGGLWLKRALEAMGLFCLRIVDDHKAGIVREDLGPHWLFAYERTLKKYHSWILQQLVKVIAKAIPSRTNFLTALSDGQKDPEAHTKCVQDMEAFIVPMMENLKVLSVLFLTKNIDVKDKV